MSVSLWFWLLAAVLVFWCVGVYNRVMRLRARASDALGSVEKSTRMVVQLIQTQLPTEWSALHTQARALEEAGRAALAVPLHHLAQQEFARCMDSLQQQWEASCGAPVDLAGAPVPQELQAQWDEAMLKVHTARGGFNQLVARYNESLHQYPAHLVVALMGFRPATTL